MKPFTVSEMTFKGYSRSSAVSSFIRSPEHILPETGKVGYTYSQTK